MKPPLYNLWYTMVRRCHNPGAVDYAHYGGRGISVCEQWRGRAGFHRFASEVGLRPSPQHTLDRIDNERGYEPGNVRWATHVEQHNNTRANRRITANGRSMTIAQWARELGVRPSTIWQRRRNGWSDVDAVTRAVVRPKGAQP